MSNLEKSVDEQIIELVKQYERITIKQIAERLGKDLGQISKKITALEKKNILKKMEYNPTGSKTHPKMVSFADGYIPENSPVGQVQNTKVNLISQLDKVNLSPEDNLMSQLDNDKLKPTPDIELDLDELDLSDIDFSEKKVENYSSRESIDKILCDKLTKKEIIWLTKRVYAKATNNGKFEFSKANKIMNKLKIGEYDGIDDTDTN